MKEKIKGVVMFSGVWVMFVNLVILFVCELLAEGKWDGINSNLFGVVMIITGFEIIAIMIGNLVFHGCYGAREITIMSFAEGLWLRKKYDNNDLAAKFPRVSKELRADENKGNIILGEWQGHTIAKSLNQQSGHVGAMGSSGCGKSTNCIDPSILDIVEKNQNGDDSTFIAIDIKGELEAITEKVCKKNGMDCKYKVLNPEKPNSYGFNPYFMLNMVQNDDERLEIIEEIANILIPTNHDEKGNGFWLDGARSYLTGAMWFYYKYKRLGFIDTLKYIARQNPYTFAEQVQMVGDRYIDVYYASIYGYVEKREKTLNFFFNEVSRNIQLFGVNLAIESIFYKSDEMCITPMDLLNGTSIFLQFSETKMPIYNKACALIINMFIRYFTSIDESTTRIPNTAWLLDEFSQLPYMPAMDRCISTIRSKGVTLVFCLQEPENQLISKYGKESAKIFMQNITYNIIYGITGDSAEYYSKEVGEYDKRVKSYKKHNKSDVTISTRKERIMPAKEFRNLKDKKKAVLISPYGYGYIDVMPWYKNKKWNS